MLFEPQVTNLSGMRLADRSAALQSSQIRDVAEEGSRVDGVIPLWFGEGAWASPAASVDAAVKALQAGDHFYQSNNGKPELRAAISAYMGELHARDFDISRVTVTASGMQGVALTAQALVTPGDRVVTVQPAWPNLAEAFRISGADIHFEILQVANDRWVLDLDRLIAALTSDTKAVLINSPNNPTGWTMPENDLGLLLDHCRRLGIWIVSDDVYNRLYRHGNCAPSLLSMIETEDRVISVNSFSKAWSMTGWRLGWITAPSELEDLYAMLTEFNIAGPPGFVQAAGATILREGEADIAILRERLEAGYAICAGRLSAMPGVDFIQPDGAFYCFFRVAGMTDSLSVAKHLVHQAKVGLAPGIAFGPSGEGYLRLCYAQPEDVLEEVFDRLEAGIAQIR